MNCKMFKIKVVKKDDTFFYIFYAAFETGLVTRVVPNEFVDAQKQKHSNYSLLVASSKLVEKFEDIKY